MPPLMEALRARFGARREAVRVEEAQAEEKVASAQERYRLLVRALARGEEPAGRSYGPAQVEALLVELGLSDEDLEREVAELRRHVEALRAEPVGIEAEQAVVLARQSVLRWRLAAAKRAEREQGAQLRGRYQGLVLAQARQREQRRDEHAWAGFPEGALDRYHEAQARVGALMAQLAAATGARNARIVPGPEGDPDLGPLVAELEQATADARAAWLAAVERFGE